MRNSKSGKKTLFFLALAGLFTWNVFAAPPVKTTFPKIGGMNIGAKNYGDAAYQTDLAKLDLVILGFYRGWRSGSITIKSAVLSLKAKNPNLWVGQYTIINEAYDDTVAHAANKDLYYKLYQANWWLRDSAGNKVQWTTAYGTFETNFTEFSAPDGQGKRYPQWLAERDFGIYFDTIPFDIWYFDNVMYKPRTHGDYNLDGINDNPDNAGVQAAFRRGMAAEWQRSRELKPGIYCVGNTDGDLSQTEIAGKLDGGFLEGHFGISWSPETWAGWNVAMTTYHNVMRNTVAPKLTMFNTQGNTSDYKLMRYGLASTLMDNGYYCFTDTAKGYSSVPWFDEFDVDLGTAVDTPQTSAWQKGVYRRLFQKGLALVNPKGNGTKTVYVGPGYKRFLGTQAPAINSGAIVTDSVTLPERDGIILVKINQQAVDNKIQPMDANRQAAGRIIAYDIRGRKIGSLKDVTRSGIYFVMDLQGRLTKRVVLR